VLAADRGRVSAGRRRGAVGGDDGPVGQGGEGAGLAELNKGGNAHVTSVSCGAVNDCAAGGYCADCRGHRQGFVGAERDGRWGDAVQGAPQAFVSARSHGWSARRRGGLGLPIGWGPWPISS